MNQSYPSKEIWQKLQKNNYHLLVQCKNQNYIEIMENLNHENLIIITYQLKKISHYLEQSNDLDLPYQILQEIPHLLYLLDRNKSTQLSLVILDIFQILLRKINSEFKTALIENQGIIILINRLNDQNIKILNSICFILLFFSDKLLIQQNITGAIWQMLQNLKFHKIESESCFKMIYYIVDSEKNIDNQQVKNVLEEIFQYVIELRKIEFDSQLQCLCSIIKKTQSHQKLFLFTLQQQNFFPYILQNIIQNSKTSLKFLILLLNKQKINNQIVFDICLKLLNQTVNIHYYSLGILYSNLIANLSIENPVFIQQVVKSQKILDNLFNFYDQVSITNLISFSNQVAKHNLDFELKYLMNKGLIYRYLHLLQKKDLQFQTLSLIGIKNLLDKGYIRDDIKLINKAVLKLDSSEIDKQLLSDIKHLLKQQKDQYI